MFNGLGNWQFSDKMVPTVETFAKRYHGQDHSSEGFNPWRLLYAYEDTPPPKSYPMDVQDIDGHFDVELEENITTLETHRYAPIDEHINQLKDHLEHSLKPDIITIEEREASNEQNSLELPGTSESKEPELDETDISNISLGVRESILDNLEGLNEPDSVADFVDLLENGAKELDLTALPIATVVEIFQHTSDKGLCHAVEAVCSMKHTDQARFNSTIITHLLLPRLEESKPRCNRQIQMAFSQFLASASVLNCRLMLVPLLVNVTAQHMDLVRVLLTQVKTQQHKDIILKGVVEGLSELSEPHLGLFLLLTGPTEDSDVKQQFVKLLADSADKFSKDIKFGKLLLSVIPHYVVQPDLKEQLVYIVSRHQSLVKRSALKLLENS